MQLAISRRGFLSLFRRVTGLAPFVYHAWIIGGSLLVSKEQFIVNLKNFVLQSHLFSDINKFASQCLNFCFIHYNSVLAFTA